MAEWQARQAGLQVRLEGLKAEPDGNFFQDWQRNREIESTESSLQSIARQLDSANDELPGLRVCAEDEDEEVATALAALDTKFAEEEASLEVPREAVAATKAEVKAFEEAAAAIAAVVAADGWMVGRTDGRSDGWSDGMRP